MSRSRSNHLTWRHWALATFVVASFVVVLAHLYRVQVLDHDAYMKEAAVTRNGAVTVPGPRGAILDATGYPLATSVNTWDVYIDRLQWRDHEKARAAAIGLASFLKRDAGQLLAEGFAQNTGDSLVRRNLSYDEGLALAKQELWGIRLVRSSVRLYPEGDLAGQLIGYVGRDGAGLWGVEADFDNMLRGKDGWVATEMDAIGRPIVFTRRAERPAVEGGEVQLTIDRFMQVITERALDGALQKYNAKSGSIIVMNPRTGAILAMASRPTVALSRVDFNDPQLDALVRNRAITDLYEPGSTMKTLTTAMAIDRGLVTPETTYADTGAVKVGTYIIRNWDLSAHGTTTVRSFLQNSLNTGAVWLSGRIGPDTFYQYVKAFGLGESTHVGLAGEAEGQYRSPADPNWYPVDLATNSYGQGIAVSPLQMLTAINSFANQGRLMRPYVVSKIVTSRSARTFGPVEVRQVISLQTAATMLRLMNDVVDGMPYHGAQTPGYHVAGKTGTTLVSIPTGYDLDSTIASFAGFVPYEDPQVSVLIKIDQPSGGLNLGGQVAAPVFAEVAAQIMDYLRVTPTNQKTLPTLASRP
ncbi:MAG: penicillin-binding protein 2 [Dehalococcoidia bacterium]|nr:penicillin-binding protein 2 [Dehalococcoidia bacterium]